MGGVGEDKLTGLREWCHALPKIELHAHLNGCMRDSTLLELARDLGRKGLVVLADVEPVILKESRTLPECFELFDLYHILATDHAIVSRVTKEAVEDFASDNVVYLELRTTPKNNKAKGMSKHSYVNAVLDGLRSVNTVDVCLMRNGIPPASFCISDNVDHLCNSTSRRRIYVRLLLSIDRRESTAAALETVDLALTMKSDGVAGIDLSGNPVVGEWNTFLPALKHAKEHGLPITIHCGEVPNKKEVQEILEFNPERIGHACCLEDEEWEKLKSLQIPIEICLTSNIRTNCVPSMDDHHFVDLYKGNHPMILCTDDPGLFSTSLSNEYFLAASTFGLDKRQLHELAKDAVEFIFADDGVKVKLGEIFSTFEEKLPAS